MTILKEKLQKSAVAITQNTDKLLCDWDICKKAMLQDNPSALSSTVDLVQKISTTRRAKIKPTLSNQCAHMCELEFEHSKYLFGEDITKNISRVRNISKLKKLLTMDYSKSFHNLNSNKYKYLNYTYSSNSNNNKGKHFL